MARAAAVCSTSTATPWWAFMTQSKRPSRSTGWAPCHVSLLARRTRIALAANHDRLRSPVTQAAAGPHLPRVLRPGAYPLPRALAVCRTIVHAGPRLLRDDDLRAAAEGASDLRVHAAGQVRVRTHPRRPAPTRPRLRRITHPTNDVIAPRPVEKAPFGAKGASVLDDIRLQTAVMQASRPALPCTAGQPVSWRAGGRACVRRT